ncbi:parasitic phase-specific protein PSP-1 [Verticillium dahliae]|nr:parasitic phase-specific protein PSP-1 [Verticillium dahliae]
MNSYYEYRLSIGANATMLALFSLSALAYITTYANRWDENGFLIQICCLTIGPAFLAAGIYLCLRRIVYAYGAENSRIKPEWYTSIVSRPSPRVSPRLPASDASRLPQPASAQLTRNVPPSYPVRRHSLVLQALGGAMASIALDKRRVLRDGRQHHARRPRLPSPGASAPPPALDQDRRCRPCGPRASSAPSSPRLALSFVCIFIRCVFPRRRALRRLDGPLMRRQDLFIAFESAMIATAVLLLNVLHPAWACAPLLEGVGGLHVCGRRGAREKGRGPPARPRADSALGARASW